MAAHRKRGIWKTLVAWNDAFEDSWIGDLIGVVLLFALLYVLILIGWALQ